MCNGEFLSKESTEAWEYLNSLSKNSQAWKTEEILE